MGRLLFVIMFLIMVLGGFFFVQEDAMKIAGKLREVKQPDYQAYTPEINQTEK